MGFDAVGPTDPPDPLASPPTILGATPALTQAVAASWPGLSREARAAVYRQADEIRHALRVVAAIAGVRAAGVGE